MGRWLFKTEPAAYSFDQLQRDGRAVWDGVQNPQALKNLGQVRQGDCIFVYHTGSEKAVIGTATALGTAYPDPKRDDPKLLVIDIAAGKPLTRPVTLAEIKATPACAGWDLVRLPRLSIMAVSAEQWAAVERLAAA